MRVGVFRRIGAYLLDLVPIISVLSLLFQFLVGDILKPEDYDILYEEYVSISDIADEYYTEREAGLITEDEYNAKLQLLVDDNQALIDKYTDATVQYYGRVIMYYVISSTILYYFYNGVTKGNTLGRQLLKIELTGKINWWTLLLREVIWKSIYYMLTLGIIGILVDIFMIAFTSKKKAPRDYISGIDVKFQGVDYPF